MTPSTLLIAFDAIKRIPNYDYYGAIVAALKLTSILLLDEMRSFFARICGSTSEM